MVQIRKPVVRSENLIDLTTKSGPEGRATNRLARSLKSKRLAEELLAEALAQALKARQRRPR